MFVIKSSRITKSVEFKFVLNTTVRCSSTTKRNTSGLSYKHNASAYPLRHVPLGQVLEEAANKWPDRPAIVSRHEGKIITYSQLLEQSDQVAAALKQIGMEAGDRLGIWMPNYSQWVVLMMAAARGGMISVAINHMFRQREMDYALKKVGVKTLVAPGSRANKLYYNVLADIIPELPKSKAGVIESGNFKNLKRIVLIEDEGSPGTLSYDNLLTLPSTEEIATVSRESELINPDSGCNIQYTSGTTGNPKAAILSHHNIVNNGFSVGIRNELDTSYKKICVQVPLFHVFGVVATASAGIQHGATMIFPSPTYSPKANLEALQAEKCDVIHGTPTMHVDLVNEVKSRGLADLRSEIAVTGGSPITPKLVQDMADVLKVSKIKSIYGMTETSAVNFQSLPGEDQQRSLHFVGHLQDHLEAKVVDSKGNLVPFGQPGELMIRGYSLMKGYFDDELKTQECIGEDRWLRTGDQFVLHEDGYGQIVGRLKDIIIRGGENVAPKEIEDVISTHPDVLECHVFGIEDERLGEEICAAVRLRETCKFEEEVLKKHVLKHLTKYKVPRVFQSVDTFPKTASGKVQKFKLRQMVESGKL